MLSLNLRGGLNLPYKQCHLRFLNQKLKLPVIGILETKKEEITNFIIRRLWTDSDFAYSYMPSVGASVGLCLIWNKILVVNTSVLQGSH